MQDIDQTRLRLNIKKSCLDVYRECVGDALDDVTKADLELLIMQNAYNKYKYYNVKDEIPTGDSDKLLEGMVSNLCNGSNHTNEVIKSFLISNGYAQSDKEGITFTNKLRLLVLDKDVDGGFVQRDKKGNVCISVYKGTLKDDTNFAVTIGHEICHLMIDNNGPNVFISAECEALCDCVGLMAARGAGYDTKGQIDRNNFNYSREGKIDSLKKMGEDPNSDDFNDKVDMTINNSDIYYMPDKLNKIAEIINKNVPIASKMCQQTKQARTVLPQQNQR